MLHSSPRHRNERSKLLDLLFVLGVFEFNQFLCYRQVGPRQEHARNERGPLQE